MSTPGAIGRALPDGFVGVYHHWDSYPHGLGATLFHLARTVFKGDLEQMSKTLIDDHPAGWSTINGADWSLPAGWRDRSTDAPHGPECYCHGGRHDEPNAITAQNAADCGVEWAYAIDARARTLKVYSSYNDDGTKMMGMFGCGNPDALWPAVVTIELDGPEPDWGLVTGQGVKRIA